MQKGTRVCVAQMDNWEIKDFKGDLDRNFDHRPLFKEFQDNGWEVLSITSNGEWPVQRLIPIMRKKRIKATNT